MLISEITAVGRAPSHPGWGRQTELPKDNMHVALSEAQASDCVALPCPPRRPSPNTRAPAGPFSA